MCGLQCGARKAPEDPEQILKEVLYYDGKIYQGWQNKTTIKQRKIQEEIQKLQKQVDSLQKQISSLEDEHEDIKINGYHEEGCCYSEKIR